MIQGGPEAMALENRMITSGPPGTCEYEANF